MPVGDFKVNRSCAASIMPTTKIDAETITTDAMCWRFIQYLLWRTGKGANESGEGFAHTLRDLCALAVVAVSGSLRSSKTVSGRRQLPTVTFGIKIPLVG